MHEDNANVVVLGLISVLPSLKPRAVRRAALGQAGLICTPSAFLRGIIKNHSLEITSRGNKIEECKEIGKGLKDAELGALQLLLEEMGMV